ncbi:MAG: hypothetical protein H6Q19_1181 [Bacteroidetes bacterium]|nr:hypothetical protein [Bacteroidota bacterium]
MIQVEPDSLILNWFCIYGYNYQSHSHSHDFRSLRINIHLSCISGGTEESTAILLLNSNCLCNFAVLLQIIIKKESEDAMNNLITANKYTKENEGFDTVVTYPLFYSPTPLVYTSNRNFKQHYFQIRKFCNLLFSTPVTKTSFHRTTR